MVALTHWQYPAKTEPVFVPDPGAVEFGDWYGQLSQPVLPLPRPTVGESLFVGEPVDLAAAPSMDGWFSLLSQPLVTPVAFPTTGKTDFTSNPEFFAAAPSMDGWYMPLQDPIVCAAIPQEFRYEVFAAALAAGSVFIAVESDFTEGVTDALPLDVTEAVKGRFDLMNLCLWFS